MSLPRGDLIRMAVACGLLRDGDGLIEASFATPEKLARFAAMVVDTPPGRGSSQAGPGTGNSNPDLGLLRDPPKGVVR